MFRLGYSYLKVTIKQAQLPLQHVARHEVEQRWFSYPLKIPYGFPEFSDLFAL